MPQKWVIAANGDPTNEPPWDSTLKIETGAENIMSTPPAGGQEISFAPPGGWAKYSFACDCKLCVNTIIPEDLRAWSQCSRGGWPTCPPHWGELSRMPPVVVEGKVWLTEQKLVLEEKGKEEQGKMKNLFRRTGKPDQEFWKKFIMFLQNLWKRTKILSNILVLFPQKSPHLMWRRPWWRGRSASGQESPDN